MHRVIATALALAVWGLVEPAPAQTVTVYGSRAAAGDGYRGGSIESTVLEAGGDFRLDLGARYDRGTRRAVLYPESSSGAVTARASRSIAGPLRQWFGAHLAAGHRDPSDAYRTFRPWNVGGRTPRLRLGTGVDFDLQRAGGLFVRFGLQWERGTEWTERFKRMCYSECFLESYDHGDPAWIPSSEIGAGYRW